jgi:hypothetical protein
MNVIDFDGKKVLIRPGATDKGEGKEVIIGNARKADGNNKISYRKVVAEKTPDGGETVKVTITNAGGQSQTGDRTWEPVLRIADGPVHRREQSGTSPDSLGHSNRRSGNAKEPRRPRTFKPRQPEIGTWKTNTFKVASRLVKSSPTFDQLLSKSLKKKATKNFKVASRLAPVTGHQSDLAYKPRSGSRLGRLDHLANRKGQKVIMFN